MSKPASGHCDIAKPCPFCGQRKLELRWWLEAKPVGTFSLAGAQLKFSAVENAVVQCHGCEAIIPGTITADAHVENGRFVSGHFEASGRVVK